MENGFKAIVYVTLNKVNYHIYVGVHMTKNPNVFDGYIGCGITRPNCWHVQHPKTPFQYAVKKYGYDAFSRITLKVFDNYEDALKFEELIVNEEFLKRRDVYNSAIGGNGIVVNRQIPVYQYDLNGNFIREFDSYSNAGRYYNCHEMVINNAVKYKSVTLNSYWSTEKVNQLDINDYMKKQSKTIYVYNKNYELVNAFDSIGKCAKYFKTKYWNIQKIARNGEMINNYYLSYNLIQNLNLANLYLLKSNRIASQPYKRKSVLQYDKNGNFIQEWESYTACRKEFPNVHKCLMGKTLYCKGYMFKYKESEDIV